MILAGAVVVGWALLFAERSFLSAEDLQDDPEAAVPKFGVAVVVAAVVAGWLLVWGWRRRAYSPTETFTWQFWVVVLGIVAAFCWWRLFVRWRLVVETGFPGDRVLLVWVGAACVVVGVAVAWVGPRPVKRRWWITPLPARSTRRRCRTRRSRDVGWFDAIALDGLSGTELWEGVTGFRAGVGADVATVIAVVDPGSREVITRDDTTFALHRIGEPEARWRVTGKPAHVVALRDTVAVVTEDCRLTVYDRATGAVPAKPGCVHDSFRHTRRDSSSGPGMTVAAPGALVSVVDGVLTGYA